MRFQTAALVVAFCGSVLAAPSGGYQNERRMIPKWPLGPFDDSDFSEASHQNERRMIPKWPKWPFGPFDGGELSEASHQNERRMIPKWPFGPFDESDISEASNQNERRMIPKWPFGPFDDSDFSEASHQNERRMIPKWPKWPFGPFEDSDLSEASPSVQPVARAAFEEGGEIALIPNLLDLMRKALFELLKKRLAEFEQTDAGSVASDDSDPKNLGSKLAALGPLEVDLPGVDATVTFEHIQ